MSEKYRGLSGKLDKAYNIAFLSPLDTRRDNDELWNLVSRRGVTKVHRMEAALQLTDNILAAKGLSGFKRRLACVAYDESELPFNAHPDLIAHGFMNHVFRLDEVFKGDRFVLKTLMATAHMDYAELLELASQMNKTHEAICRFYDAIPEAIIPSSVLVMRSPFRGHRSIGILQQMVETPMSDLLRDYTPAEAALLCAHDPEFADTLSTFIGITLDLWNERGIAIDLVGRNNLAVIEESNMETNGNPGFQLILPDTFSIHTRGELETRSDDVKKEFENAFERLETIRATACLAEIA